MHERPEPSRLVAGDPVAGTAAFEWLDGPLVRRSDARGSASHFDAAWLRFTARALDDSLHNGWLQDVHPEDRPRCVSIHAEMLASRSPYTLDYRLRHAVLGHRWVRERAAPVIADDGRFDGFEHHSVDVQDSTELGERLAERLGRMRLLLRNQTTFAAALAEEIEHLPLARVKVALDAFAALAHEPTRQRSKPRPVAGWLGRIVDDACASLPAGSTVFALALPPEPLQVEFDSAVLSKAMTNALVCTALLAGEEMSADAATVRAERVGGALLIDLPALPGSSAFALLELALRACQLSSGQVVHAAAGLRRWRVALPLAQATR